MFSNNTYYFKRFEVKAGVDSTYLDSITVFSGNANTSCSPYTHIRVCQLPILTKVYKYVANCKK